MIHSIIQAYLSMRNLFYLQISKVMNLHSSLSKPHRLTTLD